MLGNLSLSFSSYNTVHILDLNSVFGTHLENLNCILETETTLLRFRNFRDFFVLGLLLRLGLTMLARTC